MIPFDSDITTVIYISYLVDANKLESRAPVGLEIQRLGPDGRYALFTALTYRHGRLGPRIARKLPLPWPCAIQSNWRIHVVDPRSGARGIHFVTNAADSPIVSIGGRLMLEAMPMHLLASAVLAVDIDRSTTLTLTPGSGSGPDLTATLKGSATRILPASWGDCFTSYESFLEYCVPQNRAMASQPWYHRISRQEIHLDIPLSECYPLEGSIDSHALRDIVGERDPICFIVDQVAFGFEGQHFDTM